MIYVTESMVLEIYEKQNENLVLLPFIMAAEQLTNKIEAYITSNGKEISIANLTEVQRWLAAHFTTANEKVTSGEGVSGVSESYDLSTAVGLNNSHFGSTAILLDSSGYLRKLDAGEISDVQKQPYLYNL